MTINKLVDNFSREHSYLRISLTDVCNLRCTYCMPEEKVSFTKQNKLMTVAEIVTIASVFVELGITKIRLTGGEPLVRKEAQEIILQLSKLPVELTISTNGVFVDEFIDTFIDARIKKINISLDTLNPEEFKIITKRGDFEKIMNNIYLLLSKNFEVKVNMVLMKKINESAIVDFIEWTKNYPLEVRFIEFMPFDGNKWNKEKVLPYSVVLTEIEKLYPIIKLKDLKNDTSKKYKVEGHLGSFAFISTVSEPFCGSCNRLRITADGKMKNCLFSESEADLLSSLRLGKDIKSLILENVLRKKFERGGRFDFENIANRSMVKIGG